MFFNIYGSNIDEVYDEACAVLRPDWDGTTPSMLMEAINLAAEPVSLLLLIASLCVFWWRSFWGAALISAIWAIWVADIVAQFTVHDPLFTAQEWGCIGDIALFLGLAIALCVVMMIYTSYFRFFRSKTEA